MNPIKSFSLQLGPGGRVLLGLVALWLGAGQAGAAESIYVKRGSREESRVATMKAIDEHFGVAGLRQGPWQFVGPFDNTRGSGINRAFPPEDNLNLQAEYLGVNPNGPYKLEHYRY